ncbi:MAG: hypothetical protein NTV86_21605 [Planctomycetota bacterium]|nr:hypothetical protein [Planctomycetota bacterium]
MSESIGRANLPTGQSLPISRENRERRGAPRTRRRRRGHEDEAAVPPPPEAAGDADDIDETGHIDLLI